MLSVLKTVLIGIGADLARGARVASRFWAWGSYSYDPLSIVLERLVSEVTYHSLTHPSISLLRYS